MRLLLEATVEAIMVVCSSYSLQALEEMKIGRLKRLIVEAFVTVVKVATVEAEAISMRVDTYVQSVKLLLGLRLRS